MSVFPVAFRQVTVSDAWWHVSIGRWIVERRSLPDLNLFYFTGPNLSPLLSELRWQWLGDVLLFGAFALSGDAGIQLLALSCLAAGLFFLAQWRPAAERGPWTLLLLALIAVATYQLQLPRNSVFSLALFPAILWVAGRNQSWPSLGEYRVAGLVLLCWSFLHGSCIFGWAAGFSIFGMRVLRAFWSSYPPCFESHSASEKKPAAKAAVLGRVQWVLGLRALALWGAMAGLSLAILIAGRDNALDLLFLPAKALGTATLQQPGTEFPDKASSLDQAEVSIESARAFTIKQWLNSTLWKPEPGIPWSNDFWSPFDLMPDLRPVEATILLVLLSFISIFLSRCVRWELLPVWAASVFFGAGYVRMFGYAAIASAALVLSGSGACFAISQKSVRFFSIAGWLLVAVWISVAWVAFFSGSMGRLISDGQHVSAWGKAPIYDERVADWMMDRFAQERTFTTIESGSYCLLRWGFRKPVFLDGFFAPHPKAAWDTHNEALGTGTPEPLYQKFGMTTAIIPNTSEGWFEIFLRSEDWYPAAVGKGSVVFLHRSIPLPPSGPEIFFSAEDMISTSAFYRNNTMRVLFQSISDPNGFPEYLWTSHPNYESLKNLAIRIYQRVNNSDE